MTPKKLSPQDAKQAYEEFEIGLKQLRHELTELVGRTIKHIDTKQADKLLKKIQKL